VPDTDLRFVVVRDPVELRAHLPAWEDLGAHAVEPNPFYEPFMFLPAIEEFGKQSVLQFVFVYAMKGHSPTFGCGCIAIATCARR
jgi:hypothetical protein